MHTWAVFGIFAAAAAAMQSNPHLKLKHSRPELPALNKRSVEIEERDTYKYLTNKTKGTTSESEVIRSSS